MKTWLKLWEKLLVVRRWLHVAAEYLGTYRDLTF